MAEVTYPDGWGSPPSQKTIEQVFARSSVQMLHPEYSKRYRGLMIASGGILGIGGGGRTTEQQESVFLQRHHKVSSGGCCSYKGQRYQLNTGMAHAAPPGRSFHEPLVQGYAAAVDAVGDLRWAALHCEAYGLEQATWGGEDWHFQLSEYPHSVSQWQKAGSLPPQKWTLPGEAKPPEPTPVPPEPTPVPPTPTPSPTLEDDNMLFISRLDSNPYLIIVGDGISSRRIRSDETDELTAALKNGTGPAYHDPTKPDRPVIRDINALPKMSDDWQQVLGVETTESLNQT